MNILVIGSGGREHALVWKLAQSPMAKKIYCAPGNAGIAAQAECVDIATTDIQTLIAFAKEKKIDLTIVGPEAPLALGIVDAFQKNDLKIFGPTQKAAQLESSKVYTKEFCRRYQIPQAPYQIFKEAKSAKSYVKNRCYPLVVKADGLAQGKGVVVCQTIAEADQAIEELLVAKKFGPASRQIVIEDFLQGEEVSFIAVVDGHHLLPLASAKDHKRLLDGDRGPNTGGMGAYSPSPLITSSISQKIMEQVMKPAVKGMAADGTPFVGFLYAGLMIHNGEPQLLEFNVRLGDPETQAILPRLKSDLVAILEAALEGNLNTIKPSWKTEASASLVMATKGYPEKYETGFSIQGLKEAQALEEVIIFHAGTGRNNETLVTAGGRVLGVTALGKNIRQACQRAYEAASKISWQGCYYRKDIGR